MPYGNQTMIQKPKVIAVIGPTAVGKSALAVELALRFGGEIISCDSMQVYRGMDIGTGKVTPAQMRGVPHHMIDIVDPNENFSCAEYAERATQVAKELAERGTLPIFCGGTGQYLDAVLTGNVFSQAGEDPALRERLSARERDSLWEELQRIDPVSAEAIHPNNKKRVVRALETYYLTGTPKSEWDRRSRLHESPWDALMIGLRADREILWRRIETRVDGMIAQGLAEEVRSLDLQPGTTAAEAIGYKELRAHLAGAQSLEEATDQIKRASRQYAKRQMTWFRANPAVHWLDTDALSGEVLFREAERLTKEFL